MKKKLTLVFAFVLMCITTAFAQSDTFSGYTVADEGAWCWFADPRALHYENDNGTINATYLGYIDYHGSIKATQIDYITGTTSEVMIRSWFQPDDHDNPAFLVLPDERIMIIYSRHTDEACFYYRISKRPGDITCLGEEKVLKTANNTTYPNPYILSDDPDHIYMCWRGIGWHPTVAQMSMPDANDDISFTWGPYQMVQSTGARPYAKYMSNGKDKIYLAYTTGHPDNEYPNWLYCNVFDVNDKSLYDIKGNKLSTVANGTFKVYKTDSYKSSYPNTVVDATSDRRDWLWNMAFDGSGNPVIGMTKINNGKTSHDYYYAKWTGSAWQSTFIVNGGGQFHQTSGVEMCYSGGMAVDRDNPQDVYCSVPVNGVYEIIKYTMSADGKKVASSEAVTKNSKLNNARPFVIEGTKDDALRVAWMNGYYYYWIVNTTYKNAYPTSIMANKSLPENLTSTEGKSVSMNIKIDPDSYSGDLLTWNGMTWGVNASTQHSYVKVDGTTYDSQNVLGTADSWQTENTATTGGKWFSKTKLGEFNLSFTYDGKHLTVYRNGIIEQQVECTLSGDDSPVVSDNVTVNTQTLYQECLTQSALKNAISKAELDALSLPASVNTDIVLPTSTASGKSITWTSSNEDVLSSSGIVNLPSKESTVVLTADVNGTTKTFSVNVEPRDVDKNIRARYTFDEGDYFSLELVEGEPVEYRVNDVSGNDNHLYVYNASPSTFVDNKLDLTSNTASGFDKNIYGITSPGILKGLRSYTVLLTATAKSLSSSPRFYDFGGGSGNSVFLRANALSAGIKYNGGTTTMVNGATTLATGKEYKLAVTFDAGTKTTKIYVDGVEDASGTANQNEPYMVYESAGDARNYIGRTQWWDGAYAKDNVDFVGTIDDFVVYDIALTQKEVCDAQGISFQEKEYATTLTNGDFEASYSVLSGSGVSSDRAIYIPEEWTVDYSTRNENDFNALKDGDLYYSQFFADKPQNTNGGKQTMWIRQRWGTSSITFYQELKPEAGKYTLTADIFGSDTKDESYVYVNNIHKSVSAANTWETVSFDIETDGETVYTIGLRTDHTNSDAERILAYDNFILTKVEDPIPDGVIPVNNSSCAERPEYYNTQGFRLTSPTKGVNIVKYPNGQTNKVVF